MQVSDDPEGQVTSAINIAEVLKGVGRRKRMIALMTAVAAIVSANCR